MITNALTDVTRLVRYLIKDNLKTDGRNIFEYKTDSSFALSETFVDSTTINVYQNDTLLDEADWSFDPDTNQVIVDFQTSGDALVINDVIIITYSYYQRYSDAEIEGYIESAFSYFVQHKYKKIFVVA